jgi:hypothetical protein
VEKAERVGLHELPAVQQLAQQRRRLGNPHGHDRVARLHRSKQVTHRTDAADARRDPRHLVEGPALGEFLEPADLRHVQLRARDLAIAVQVDGDFRVSFDAGHGIDGDLFHSGYLLCR